MYLRYKDLLYNLSRYIKTYYEKNASFDPTYSLPNIPEKIAAIYYAVQLTRILNPEFSYLCHGYR